MKIKGKILNGKYIGDKPDLSKYEGKEVEITITEYKPTRRLTQNNLYWLWCQILEEESGYNRHELHGYFKYIFIAREHLKMLLKPAPFLTIDKYIEYSNTNEIMKVLNTFVTTTVLNIKEFSEYMNKVSEWASKNYEIDLTAITEKIPLKPP